MEKRLQLKLTLCVLLLCVINEHTLKAQDGTTLTPSADGLALINSIANPVNHHTGVANIQVPLHTYSHGDIQVPIVLSYQSSGIKVQDLATGVGLGWRYSAGGKVTRVVRKFPDEKVQNLDYVDNRYPNGIFWFSWQFNSYQDICDLINSKNKLRDKINENYVEIDLKADSFYWDETDEDDVELDPETGFFYWNVPDEDYVEFDTEADIFYYEIPGRSGMFVFGHDGIAHTIPYQPIKIQWINRSHFVITDENGTKYTFGSNLFSKEVSHITRPNANILEGKEEFSYTSTWWLDSIKSIKGYEVKFSYGTFSTYKYSNSSRIWKFRINYDSQNKYLDNKHIICTSFITVEANYVSKISSPSGSVVFTRDIALNGSPCMISGMNVFNRNGTKIKELIMDYSRFENGSIKLDRISAINGYSLNTLYTFVYNTSVNLPSRDSYSFDHWGYFNGKDNDSKPYPTIHPGWQNRGYWHHNTKTIEGADRTPSQVHAQANILKKILYKSGESYTEYEYELNRALYFTHTVQECGGLRIKEIKNHADGETSIVRYKYDTYYTYGKCSGIPVTEHVYYVLSDFKGSDYYYSIYSKPLNNLYDFAGYNVEYSKVIECLPNGSRIEYEYTTSAEEEYKDIEGKYFENGGTAVEEDNSTSYYRFPPNTSRFWRRGLLKKVTKYENDNLYPLEETEYNYSFGTPKAIVECYTPEKRYRNGINIYEWISEPILVSSIVKKEGAYNLKSTTTFEYDSEYWIPTKTTISDVTGNTFSTETSYPFSYPRSYNHDGRDLLIYLSSNNILNCPIEQVNYKNNKITGASVNLFRYNPSAINNKAELECNMSMTTAAPSNSYTRFNITNTSYDTRLEVNVTVNEYDEVGNIISYYTNDGVIRSSIYGYDNTLTIAEIVNARHSKIPGCNEVYYTGFEDLPVDVPTAYYGRNNVCKALCGSFIIDLSSFKSGTYVLSYYKIDCLTYNKEYVEVSILVNSENQSVTLTGSSSRYIDDVRILPKDAYMTTSSYLPGIGVISEMDANGRYVYYGYNKFGKLSAIYDNDWNTIKVITYDNITN